MLIVTGYLAISGTLLYSESAWIFSMESLEKGWDTPREAP